MIKLVPVEVKSHSGYKSDEYPLSFELDFTEYSINEITDRWYQGESDPQFPASNYFRVKTASGDEYILKHEVKKDKWFLVGK